MTDSHQAIFTRSLAPSRVGLFDAESHPFLFTAGKWGPIISGAMFILIALQAEFRAKINRLQEAIRASLAGLD
jgi:hypothetical protein